MTASRNGAENWINVHSFIYWNLMFLRNYFSSSSKLFIICRSPQQIKRKKNRVLRNIRFTSVSAQMVINVHTVERTHNILLSCASQKSAAFADISNQLTFPPDLGIMLCTKGARAHLKRWGWKCGCVRKVQIGRWAHPTLLSAFAFGILRNNAKPFFIYNTAKTRLLWIRNPILIAISIG